MTNFPTSLDNSTTLPAEGASTALSTNHVTAHQNIQDALEAVEAKVGVDGSAVTTSHDYKLGEVTSTDKAVGKTATQTVSNKTLSSPKITVGSDASGDLHYTSNADGTQSRLAIGTNNYILRSNGSAPTWSAETATVDASTTAKGVVEEATSAEITSGTAAGGTGARLFVNPAALASSTPVFDGSGLTNTVGSIWKNGTTTYDLSTASGNQTIAHGCGRTPKFIEITYFSNSTMATPWITWGSGVYNGTTYSTTYMIASETMVFQSAASNNSSIIYIEADNGGNKQSATVTFDSTNITLAWTKTGTPAGTAYLMWKAVA